MQECKPIKVPIHVDVKLSIDSKNKKRKRIYTIFHMLVWLEA